MVDRKLCAQLWDCDDFDWECKPSVGSAGGLLILCHPSRFVLTEVFSSDHLLGVVGAWGKQQLPVTIINVHAPCDLSLKRDMWREIVHLCQERGGERWCVGGDFNSITSVQERKGVEAHGRHEEIAEFTQFISDAGLTDLPLIGRKYTWYRANGSAMSRLDRFLLSESWLQSWEGLSQWGLPRSVSDHCAVVLKEKGLNWGPNQTFPGVGLLEGITWIPRFCDILMARGGD